MARMQRKCVFYVHNKHFARQTWRLLHAVCMKSPTLRVFLLVCVAWCVACSAAFAQSTPNKLEFEVASIKPSAPQPMGRIMIQMGTDAGMLRYTNVAMKDIVRVAYKIKDFQVDGPDWLGSERYDIVAKLPDGAKEDQVPEMLQALLAERFKLAVHHGSKEEPIYALIVGKDGAKLKPAESQPAPAAAPTPGGGAPSAGAPRGTFRMMMSPNGMRLQLSTASVSEVADAVSRVMERPVVDMTDIKGQYEFDFTFQPEKLPGLRRGGPGAAANNSGAADSSTEPAPTLGEAIAPYGLKLDARKAPMDMLIVDHIEKTPTEN